MPEQQRYQVRFEWGVTGALATAGLDDMGRGDVTVWVDVIAEEPPPLDELPGTWIVAADFRDAAATGNWIADLQQRLGRRLSIAVIAAGATRVVGRERSPRYAVEDQLAAGAVIDALGARGIDATSPEAAATQAAYQGLGRAIGHLLTASVSATAVIAPAAPITSQLAKSDPHAQVRVLREG